MKFSRINYICNQLYTQHHIHEKVSWRQIKVIAWWNISPYLFGKVKPLSNNKDDILIVIMIFKTVNDYLLNSIKATQLMKHEKKFKKRKKSEETRQNHYLIVTKIFALFHFGIVLFTLQTWYIHTGIKK